MGHHYLGNIRNVRLRVSKIGACRIVVYPQNIVDLSSETNACVRCQASVPYGGLFKVSKQ